MKQMIYYCDFCKEKIHKSFVRFGGEVDTQWQYKEFSGEGHMECVQKALPAILKEGKGDIEILLCEDGEED